MARERATERLNAATEERLKARELVAASVFAGKLGIRILKGPNLQEWWNSPTCRGRFSDVREWPHRN